MIKSTYDIIEEFREVKMARSLLIAEHRTKKKQLRRLRRDIKDHEKSRLILTEAGKIAQKNIKHKVENLLTLAIRTVFDRPLTFKLILEEKRKQTEARPVVIENGHEFAPKDDLGGGIIDICSFALRLVLWSISNPRSRNVFLLDEPFKFTGALIVKAGEVLQYLSKELGFQVILVSHDDELIAACDRVYRIHHDGTESVVKLIKGGRKIRRRKQ